MHQLHCASLQVAMQPHVWLQTIRYIMTFTQKLSAYTALAAGVKLLRCVARHQLHAFLLLLRVLDSVKVKMSRSNVTL